MKETIVIGYFGKGNVGDEAILSSTLHGILKHEKVIVVSDNPDETTRLHYVKSIKFKHLFSLPFWIVLKRPKRILFPGGGYFYGNAVRAAALITAVGKIFGSKVDIVAVGIGPYLNHEIMGFYNNKDKFKGLNKYCLRLMFTISDYKSVRDEFSKKMVILSGERNVKIDSDPALSLKPVDKQYALELFNGALPKLNRPIVGFNLRYIPDKRIMNKIITETSKVCKFIIEKLNGSVVFVPFGVRYQSEMGKFDLINDDEFAYNMFKQIYTSDRIYLLRGRYTPSELLGMFRFFDAVIGMRLHSIVFSHIMKVPVFAISYEQKIDSFVKSKKIPYTHINDIDSQKVINFVYNIFKHE